MSTTLSRARFVHDSGDWPQIDRDDVTPNITTRLPVFRRLLKAGLECSGTHLPEVRDTVASWLNRARDPIPYVKEMLRWCLRRRSEGGLHFAIDVLSQTGELAMQYARQFQGDDAARWSRHVTTRQHPNDDAWRVLLVAASRASASEPDRLILLLSCWSAGNRGIREAIVDGLGELGTPTARRLLDRLARRADDPLIRQVAAQTRDDLP